MTSLTLVIPTRNRPDFLQRAVDYYARQRFSHAVVIADSSDGDPLRRNQAFLGPGRAPLAVAHSVFPAEIPVLEKLSRVLEAVRTPYTVMGSDDDFFVPEALEAGVRFLEGHSDYGLAHGEALLFGLRSGTTHGEVAWIKPYLQRTIADATGAGRLLNHFRPYTSTWYSVHRTELLADSIRQAALLEMDYCFLEMVPSCLAVVRGKAVRMDGLYMARQAHAGTTSSNGSGSSFDPFAWIADPAWPGQYRRFQECLSKALADEDRIPVEQAQEIVKRGFWSYLSEILAGRWESRYGADSARPVSPIRRMARRVPGVPELWRGFRRAATPPAFRPIRQAVTAASLAIPEEAAHV